MKAGKVSPRTIRNKMNRVMGRRKKRLPKSWTERWKFSSAAFPRTMPTRRGARGNFAFTMM